MLDGVFEKGDLEISLLRFGYEYGVIDGGVVCGITCCLEGGCGMDWIAILIAGKDVLCLGRAESGIPGMNKPDISGPLKNPVCI